MPRTITFYFDVISPYAYLAWTQIHTVAERHDATVEPVPVLFAGLLNHHGQKGPAEIPAKRVWVFKELARRSRMVGVPLAFPKTHPFNPLTALRAVSATPMAARRALIDALFAVVWGGSDARGLEEPDAVRDAATRAGMDGEALIASTRTPEVKAALRATTERAIEAGVFGVPTMQIGDELFFGLDSLDLVELHLRGQDPLPGDLMEQLAKLSPSAER
ncbi:MAG: 2-hydroxychromene-2-carboxylate isomerase [Sandaracinaceae bacterium]